MNGKIGCLFWVIATPTMLAIWWCNFGQHFPLPPEDYSLLGKIVIIGVFHVYPTLACIFAPGLALASSCVVGNVLESLINPRR